MEENKCEFCGQCLKNKYTLKTHKLSSKFCLEIQRKNNTNVIDDLKKCAYCLKSFSSNIINNHLQICKIKKQTESNNDKEIIEKLRKELIEKNSIITENDLKIIKLEAQLDIIQKDHECLIEKDLKIAKLEAQLNIIQKDHECLIEIAKQTKTTNNITNINNLAPYKIDVISDRFYRAEITKEHIMDGQCGIARAIAPCLLNDDGKRMIKCNDVSRGVFSTIDDLANISHDYKARKLALAIEPIATEKAYEIIELHENKLSKSYQLKLLKKEIKDYEEKIEGIKSTLKGFGEGTSKYKYSLQMIMNKEQYIEKNMKLIKEYEEEGIDEEDFDGNLGVEAEKLNNGMISIQEMKKDTSKFSNTLASLVKY